MNGSLVVSEKPLCIRCLGAGYYTARPDQLGYLRRPEYELRSGIRCYEKPWGDLVYITVPYTLSVRCVKCYPRTTRMGPDQ